MFFSFLVGGAHSETFSLNKTEKLQSELLAPVNMCVLGEGGLNEILELSFVKFSDPEEPNYSLDLQGSDFGIRVL